MLLLDEILAACRYGLVREAAVVHFLQTRPEKLETVLTGRDPSAALVALADYVSEIRMQKHPFTRGVGAREGIEY
jgi:cob(I)alamin adenosyltransferase